MNLSELPLLQRAELFDALSRGAAAITGSRRLARWLKREFDRAQRAAGLALWPTPDILPLSAWLQRAYADTAGADAPLLLSPLQEQALWERAVQEAEAANYLLQIPSTATAAREAWQLAHGYRLWDVLERLPLNEDARAFLRWCRRYRSLGEAMGAVDSARLPDLLASRVHDRRIAVPRQAVLCGLDETTPQERELLAALAAAGCRIARLAPPAGEAVVRRIPLPCARDEILDAARWARARLEADPRARIGIVVPDLAQHRSRVVRSFTRVMRPAAGLPGASSGALPFNVSLGEPLSACPLVDTALAALELLRGEMDLIRLGSLLRSPFLGAAESELARRALLDSELRARGEPEIELQRLRILALQADSRGELRPCAAPDLARRVEGLIALADGARAARPPSAWVETFFAALKTLGFPGERALSSQEYQALGRWRELLASLATLDAATPRLSLGAALSRVRRMAADTLFQPETPEVPVQVLGVLEAAHLEFDHLWVMGLTDEAWPPSARPNPFLPVPLQIREGLPHAGAERELAFARRLTEGWSRAAGELVLSHPRREDDRDLGVSPLIAALPAADVSVLALPDAPGYRDVIHTASRLERIDDVQGPAHPPGMGARGGTRMFQDQAACPFRAFAVHRLFSAALDEPRPGLGAAERGSLLHDVLARVWTQLRSRDGLERADPARLQAMVQSAASHSVGELARKRPRTLAGRYAALEQERLARLVLAWLKVERERGDFQVEASEARREFSVGGVTIRGKLDRVDLLPDGRRAVIDYKTGKADPKHWDGERPEEPQLPLYAVGAGDPVAAVAFARIRPGEMAFRGVAADDVGMPGLKSREDWESLLQQWRETLEALGRAFAAGAAAVDPRKYPQTCKYCGQAPLCRIHERIDLGPVEAEGDDE